MGRRRLVGVSAAGWMAALTLLSFLPTHRKDELHTRGRLHSAGHLVFFLVAGVLVSASARTARVRAVLLCLVAALAVIVEFLQHVTSGAPMEWHDVVVDLLGLTVGSILLAVAGGMRGASAAAGER